MRRKSRMPACPLCPSWLLLTLLQECRSVFRRDDCSRRDFHRPFFPRSHSHCHRRILREHDLGSPGDEMLVHRHACTVGAHGVTQSARVHGESQRHAHEFEPIDAASDASTGAASVGSHAVVHVSVGMHRSRRQSERQPACRRPALSRQLSMSREGARSNQVSCCDGSLPLRRRFGSEGPQRGPGDEVSLKIECVVDGGMDAEEALGGSS